MCQYLAPHQHCAEDNLQAVKEVVSDQDDGGSPRCPALTGTDGFDTGSGCWTRDIEGEREKRAYKVFDIGILKFYKLDKLISIFTTMSDSLIRPLALYGSGVGVHSVIRTILDRKGTM